MSAPKRLSPSCAGLHAPSGYASSAPLRSYRRVSSGLCVLQIHPSRRPAFWPAWVWRLSRSAWSRVCEECLRSLLFSALQRSEEHTSELQSLTNLVCRLLLEKKKITERRPSSSY